MPEPTDAATRWRAHWPAVLLTLAAALVALWARHALFPAFSWNRDEPVYLWQAQAMRAGHLSVGDGGLPGLFRPWLTAHADGAFFSQYTPGWPLVLALASLLTGTASTALMLGAALAVLGTYVIGIELFRDRRVATVAAGLMVASPILAIQGGVYLSYLFTLGLGLLFGALLLRSIRRDHLGELVAAGVLLGCIFMTRPYDAVLWGVAFAGYAAARHRARLWPVLGRLILCGAASLPLVIGTLAYNRHLTGGWLRFPVTAKDSLDTFGFGHRRLMPTFEIVHYDLAKALRSTLKNAFVLPWFLVGSYIGLAAAGLGLWQRRRESSTLALISLGAIFPLGYIMFWGTYLSSLAARISGPIYFVPLYAPICLSIASLLVHWWGSRRWAAVGLVIALAIGTIPAAISRFSVNRNISETQEAWRKSVSTLTDPSLVFVADTSPYLLYLNPFSSNGAALDDLILYAADNGPRMLDLIAAVPGRRAYLQQGDLAAQDIGPREHPASLSVTLAPIEVRQGASLVLHVSVRREAGAPAQQIKLTSGAGTITRSPPSTQTGGEATVEVRIGAAGNTDLSLASHGTISVLLGRGTPLERVDLVYRQVDGVIEVLTPVALFRSVPVPEGRDWRRSTALESLHVEVRSR